MTAAAALTSAPHVPTLATVRLGGQRGDRPLFRDLDFTLRPGQVLWLRGRNGRGKTSLLRLLAGLSGPADGEVQIDGVALRRLPASWRRRLVYLAHANALKDDLSVAEALGFVARLHGQAPSAEDLHAALAALGIAGWSDALVRTLSQGQRRRAALARLALQATAADPALWLLDEPFDALDDDGVAALNRLLSSHAARGGSVLLTSHLVPTLRDPVPAELNLDAFAVAA